MKNRNISIIILCKTLKVMFWCISISFHLYEQFTFVIWLQVKDDTFIDISFIVTLIFMKEQCLCERDYAGPLYGLDRVVARLTHTYQL
jgi:hypothetical protein